MLIGEGIAVISGSLHFVPGLPQAVDDLAIPVAVLSGAMALFLVAIYDKLDPTVVRICTLNQEAYELLKNKGQIQDDVVYATADNFSF